MDETQLDRIETDVRLIKVWLTGNGNPSKGLIVRVDRIEQRFLIVGFVVIPAISGIVSWIVSVVMK